MGEDTFEDFLGALLAFESGWDRERYDAGIITDYQLDQWAGGPVEAFYPSHASWGALSDAEWQTMAYRSMNSLGFVGFQFGEALLIDLGYYDATVFYGNGAASNTWQGTWTGKNGANSLDDFMTAAVQDQAILDAFGHNLEIIETGLAQSGQSLDDFIGQSATYVQNGQSVEVELSLSGILAAAHLRGAYGTLALLQNGAVSNDEYGTSILQYVDQFGGYDAPSVEALIEGWNDGRTGDEGLGGPNDDPGGEPGGDPGGDTGGDPSPGGGGAPGGGNGTAGVDAGTATVAIDWAWGQHATVAFDPQTDTVHIAWLSADVLEVSQSAAGVTFAVPSNNQSLTLAGVALDDLAPSNFTILDATAAAAILDLIGTDAANDGGDGDTDPGDTDPGDGGADDGDPHDQGGSMTMVMLAADTPSQTVAAFDPASHMIHVEPGVTDDIFAIAEVDGDVVITIDGPGGPATHVFQGLSLAQLSLANFGIAEQSTLNEVAAAIGASVSDPGPSAGFPVTYDSDGSAPPATTGTSAAGGTNYRADANADDIVGFDAAVDGIDFGSDSVHGVILTKTPAGEIAIDSPWSEAMQIVQGVTYQEVTADTFGIVGNEHLRQDVGAVLSWELGVGPRDDDTVYVRSHEYGVAEVVDDFDATTDRISFLYFGTRERLTVTDTADGLVISSLPTGQSVTLTGLALADLAPGQVEFHFDQVMEDNLEAAFGFAQDDVTLVDRTVLLTPQAPPGETTDGYQVRDGLFGDDWTGGDGGEGTPGDDGGDDTPGGGTPGDDPSDGGTGEDGGGTPSDGVVEIGWAWGVQEVVTGFDPGTDVLDFGNVGAGLFDLYAAPNGDLVIEVLDNGGHTYRLDGITAAQLSADNLTAETWNTAAIASALQDLETLA